MYIKWSLLLQEELQRSVTLHQQLQQMRGKLEAENSELSKALGRPDPRPAASAKAASRGASMPSALPSAAELQRLAGASAGGAAGCMCSGVRHASPQVAPPTGKRKRTHAAMAEEKAAAEKARAEEAAAAKAAKEAAAAKAMAAGGVWQASEPRPPTSAPSKGVGACPSAQLSDVSLCAASPEGFPPPTHHRPLHRPPTPAALRRASFGASIPMAHDLSLSDFELPTPDELDGTAASSTAGGSARLHLEEERLLESLLSSPGMSPLLPLKPGPP